MSSNRALRKIPEEKDFPFSHKFFTSENQEKTMRLWISKLISLNAPRFRRPLRLTNDIKPKRAENFTPQSRLEKNEIKQRNKEKKSLKF